MASGSAAVGHCRLRVGHYNSGWSRAPVNSGAAFRGANLLLSRPLPAYGLLGILLRRSCSIYAVFVFAAAFVFDPAMPFTASNSACFVNRSPRVCAVDAGIVLQAFSVCIRLFSVVKMQRKRFTSAQPQAQSTSNLLPYGPTRLIIRFSALHCRLWQISSLDAVSLSILQRLLYWILMR